MTKTTTTKKAIPNPLRTAVSTTERYGMLGELHSDGVIPLPDVLIDDLIKAHRFRASAEEANAVFSRMKAEDGRGPGREALLRATTPEEEADAVALTWAHGQSTDRALAESTTWHYVRLDE